MLKVLVARCAFIVLMLSMLAASGADTTVRNNELGFEITYPVSWEITDKPYKVPGNTEETVAVHGEWPKGDMKICIGVAVSHVKQGTALKDVADKMFPERDKRKYYEKAEQIKMKIAGLDSLRVTHTIHIGNSRDPEFQPGDKDRSIKEVIYVVVAGTRSYVLVASNDLADKEKYSKDIDAIVKSFKLIAVDAAKKVE